MYVIGGLDDQTSILAWMRLVTTLGTKTAAFLAASPSYQEVFQAYLHPLMTYQPLLAGILSILPFVFGNLAFNVLLVIFTLLNIFCSYLLFKRFKYGFLYALIFSFSAYFWSHFGIHIDLMSIWVLPLFLYFLQKCGVSKHFVWLGFYIAFVISISNYYGFFILVFFSLYTVLRMLFEKCFLKYSLYFLTVVIVGGVISCLFLFPFIKSTYFSAPVFSSAIKYESVLRRSYEDFFSFSGRPWYFVVPPVKNPFLGQVAINMLTKISAANYFLADDYFALEHSGSYFGVFLLLITLFGFGYSLVRGSVSLRKNVLFWGGIAGILFLLTLPPFFTLSGFKIYTPGFLMYKFFPMFRATSRLSILILLCFLVMLGYSLDFMAERLGNRKCWLTVAVTLVAFLTILETFIPFKIQKLTHPSKVYEYLRQQTPADSTFIVYPKGRRDDALFWIDKHARYLLNPVEPVVVPGIRSSQFTQELLTPTGFARLADVPADYLVVFKDVSANDVLFLKSSPVFNLVQEFSDAYLFEILL